ncbi:MAG: GNAT family N-acetyltransferase [Clostridia bacterium]|nr:GNAT family N-acetyltransferase [Clostridia bacterium]
MINFRAITEDNFDVIVHMKRPDDEHFVASNAYSLAQAWLYRDAGDVYPFAIYNDDAPVGFMMLDEDLDEKCLIIWRIMFPVENQFKGYGTSAIREIIRLAKESGKYDFMLLGCDPENHAAEHVYRKLGFTPTGVIEHGENEFRLDL